MPAPWIHSIPLTWSQQLAVTVDIAVVLRHYANDAPCSAPPPNTPQLELVRPEVLEPRRRQLRVTDGMPNILVAEVALY